MNNQKKLRILFLINDLGKGGAERFLVDLCSELQQRKDIAFVIGTLFKNNQYSNLTSNFKIVNLNFKTFSLRKKNECPNYKKLLDEFQPDIVHTHLFLAEFLSSYYVNPMIKYVCHGHDNMIQFSPSILSAIQAKENLYHFIEKRHLIRKKYRFAPTYFIANSRHTMAYYKKCLPENMQDKVRLIQYGFNFNKFYNRIEKKAKNDEVIRIINVGSFQPKKNQIFILEIAKELKKRGLKFEINLIGHGQNYELVEKLINQSGLQKEVILKGIINDVENWYKISDIYLHTAWYEPFGLVFLEAMASGLPVVTLDGKGNGDIIEHGRTGYIFTKEDPQLFADAITELAEKNEQYGAISKSAQKFAENFAINRKTDELISFYKSILTENRSL